MQYACSWQIINGKPVERRLGDWAQMKSSKGKVYYFHLKTQNSQWVEPADWKELEEKERIEEEEAAAARLAALQGCRWKLQDSNLDPGQKVEFRCLIGQRKPLIWFAHRKICHVRQSFLRLRKPQSRRPMRRRQPPQRRRRRNPNQRGSRYPRSRC